MTYQYQSKSLLTFCLALFCSQSWAAEWSSTSALLLDGDGYKNVSNNSTYQSQILTVEHSDGWKYGSNFFFFDVTNPNNASSSFYGEFSPSLSLSKISGSNLSFGIVKDIDLTATWELGQYSNAKLFGIGLDLNIPGISFAKINLYQRFTELSNLAGKTGTSPQVTIIWSAPFNIGYSQWLFDGYLDYALAENEVSKAENIVSSPRLLLDAGALWGTPKQLYFGMEYSYWNNKYGVKGISENVPQIAMKWTF